MAEDTEWESLTACPVGGALLPSPGPPCCHGGRSQQGFLLETHSLDVQRLSLRWICDGRWEIGGYSLLLPSSWTCYLWCSMSYDLLEVLWDGAIGCTWSSQQPIQWHSWSLSWILSYLLPSVPQTFSAPALPHSIVTHTLLLQALTSGHAILRLMSNKELVNIKMNYWFHKTCF